MVVDAGCTLLVSDADSGSDAPPRAENSGGDVGTTTPGCVETSTDVGTVRARDPAFDLKAKDSSGGAAEST